MGRNGEVEPAGHGEEGLSPSYRSVDTPIPDWGMDFEEFEKRTPGTYTFNIEYAYFSGRVKLDSFVTFVCNVGGRSEPFGVEIPAYQDYSDVLHFPSRYKVTFRLAPPTGNTEARYVESSVIVARR